MSTDDGAAALVLVCGLPGSGKSTLARGLADATGALWIASDAVRQETGRRGDYRGEAIDAVYRAMMERADGALAAGRSVLLDATFSSRRFRGWARDVAQRRGARFLLVRAVADEPTTLARLGRRRELSEAGPSTYTLLKDRFDRIDEPHVVVDTGSRSPAEALERTLAELALT